MALALEDELTDLLQTTKRCKLGRIIDERLTEKQRELFNAALDSDKVSTLKLVGVLADGGFPVDRMTVTRHRKGICACTR